MKLFGLTLSGHTLVDWEPLRGKGLDVENPSFFLFNLIDGDVFSKIEERGRGKHLQS